MSYKKTFLVHKKLVLDLTKNYRRLLFHSNNLTEQKFEQFRENQDYEKGFAKFYQENLKPHIEIFEQNRLDALKKSLRNIRIHAVIFIALIFGEISLVTYLTLFPHNITGDITGFILLSPIFLGIFFIVTSALAMAPINDYELKVREKILPKIFDFFPDYNYRSEIEEDIVTKYMGSQIIPQYYAAKNYDLVTGKNLTIFTSHLTARPNNRTQEGLTLFKGLFIIIEKTENFPCDIQITQNSQTSNKSSFDKIFTISATNLELANNIVTTPLKEQLLEIQRFLRGDTLEAALYQNKLILKIESNYEFFTPPNIFEKENFIDDSKLILGEMNMISKLLDIIT